MFTLKIRDTKGEKETAIAIDKLAMIVATIQNRLSLIWLIFAAETKKTQNETKNNELAGFENATISLVHIYATSATQSLRFNHVIGFINSHS